MAVLKDLEVTVDNIGNWGVCETDGGDVIADFIRTKELALVFAAAPDVRKALDMCIAFIENGEGNDEFFKCRETWRNAIAKAEGRVDVSA